MVWKRLCVVAMFLVGTLAMSGEAEAGMPIKQAGNIGVGIGAGTFATGLSGKYFMDSTLSVQGNFGWWRGSYACGWYDRRGRRYCGRNRGIALSADLLLEGDPLAGNENVTLDWEIGGGAGLGLSDFGDFGIGAAFVAGLQVNIHAVPIDLVLEYRPGFFIVNGGFGLDLVNFTGHLRYYF